MWRAASLVTLRRIVHATLHLLLIPSCDDAYTQRKSERCAFAMHTTLPSEHKAAVKCTRVDIDRRRSRDGIERRRPPHSISTLAETPIADAQKTVARRLQWHYRMIHVLHNCLQTTNQSRVSKRASKTAPLIPTEWVFSASISISILISRSSSVLRKNVPG